MAVIFGTGGNDTLTGTNTSDQFFAGAGNDVITTGGGIDNVNAGDGNDTLNLVAGDSGQGQGDADIFKISEGSNPGLNNGFITVNGDYFGLDADVLDVTDLIANGWTLESNAITSTDGQESPAVPGELGFHGRMTLTKPGFLPITIVYNDIESFDIAPPGPVDGTNDPEVMSPGYTDADGDEVDGADGVNDTIFGNGGNDTINAGLGDDSVDAGLGTDSVDGGIGNDTLDGGADEDSLTGGDGADSLIGGLASDTLAGGLGADTLAGDAGDDDIAVGGADSALGGSGDDVFTVDPTDTAGDVAATIDGGTDATSGNPDDTANGNAGDILDLGDQTEDLTVTLTANPETGTVNGLDADGTPDITFAEIEQIETGAGDDTVNGSTATGPVDVTTGAGNDSITTGTGDDSIAAGSGADDVTGGAGADTIQGGDDADTIRGVDAGDVIDGGTGGDDRDTLDLTGSAPVGGRFEITITGTDPDGDSQSGFVTFFDAANTATGIAQFTEIETIVPCFTPGTLVLTRSGDKPVELIRPGDRVLTRDNGFREVAWAGAKAMSAAELLRGERLRPVMVRAGALGRGRPERDTLFSPNHRVFVDGPDCAMMFGDHEVLVAVKHLVGRPGIEAALPNSGVRYVHFMFDRHEVVFGNGCWTESFQPGDMALNGVGAEQRAEILALFPEISEHLPDVAFGAARRVLKRQEARVLGRF